MRFLRGVRSEVDVPAGRWRASKEKQRGRQESLSKVRQDAEAPDGAGQAQRHSLAPVATGGLRCEGATGDAGAQVRAQDLRAVTKPEPPGRDKDYRRFVRGLPCCSCRRQGRMVQAHHFGERGVGQTADDYDATPCCAVCHLVWWHGKGHFKGMNRAESEAAIYKANRDALRLWIRKARGEIYVVPESA